MSTQQENHEISDKIEPVLTQAKPWTRYLTEFILLFLAVFLGFLAESYRERISEEQQANELAQSFYDELLADSIDVRISINSKKPKRFSP